MDILGLAVHLGALIFVTHVLIANVRSLGDPDINLPFVISQLAFELLAIGWCIHRLPRLMRDVFPSKNAE